MTPFKVHRYIGNTELNFGPENGGTVPLECWEINYMTSHQKDHSQYPMP
jgi:hypothetical protein